MRTCKEYEDLIWEAAENGAMPDSLATHLEVCESCRESHLALASAAIGLQVLKKVNAPDPRSAVHARIEGSRSRWCLAPAFAVAAACCLAIILFFHARWISTPPGHTYPVAARRQLPQPKTMVYIPVTPPAKLTNTTTPGVISVEPMQRKARRFYHRKARHFEQSPMAVEEARVSVTYEDEGDLSTVPNVPQYFAATPEHPIKGTVVAKNGRTARFLLPSEKYDITLDGRVSADNDNSM